MLEKIFYYQNNHYSTLSLRAKRSNLLQRIVSHEFTRIRLSFTPYDDLYFPPISSPLRERLGEGAGYRQEPNRHYYLLILPLSLPSSPGEEVLLEFFIERYV